MGRLNELKQEIAELEAKTKAQQNQTLGSEEQPAPAESDEEQIRRILNSILGLDGVQERQRIEDQTMQVCASCFTLQPKTSTACELCGDATGWLVPSEVKGNHEHDMFSRMAAEYTVEQLRIALTSGWAASPQRECVARLLLASREAQLHSQQQTNVQTAPEDSPRSMMLEQLL